MSQTKDNHFVPRFYLKNFTDDPSSKAGRFDFFSIKQNRHLGKIPYGDQMQEKYFYSKDSTTEDLLTLEFEGKHAAFLRDLIGDGNIPPASALQEMILLMHFRTRAKRDEEIAARRMLWGEMESSAVAGFRASLERKMPDIARRFSDVELRQMVSEYAEREYFKKTDISEKSINHFLENKADVSGIDYCVLRAHKNELLVSSDRPVILMNPFLERRISNFGVTGLKQLGLVLLLPLTPSLLAVGFDATIYHHPLKFGDVIKPHEVRRLNTLQIHSAVEGIYTLEFKPGFVEKVQPIIKARTGPRTRNIHLPDDYMLSFSETGLPSLSFSFLKEKRGAGDGLHFPYIRT